MMRICRINGTLWWTRRKTILQISIYGFILISVCFYLNILSPYVDRLRFRPKALTPISDHSFQSSILNSFVANLKTGTEGKKLDEGKQTVQSVTLTTERLDRNYYSLYDTRSSYLREFERHTAEIAAFHLDRVLDFRRVPPCTGRVLDFRKDILQKTNDSDILNTQRVKDGNQCIIGSCRPKFCSEQALTCAKNGTLEVSLCQRVPDAANMHSRVYPWISADRKKREEIRLICQNLKKDEFVQKNGFFLDFMEILVFDHLQVNYDRHNYKRLNTDDSTVFGIALLDNGKGFGNPFKDDIGFLTPIEECCRFRNSTFQRMLQLTEVGNKLGDKMRASLSRDPLHPVLTEDFYPALDRRLNQAVDVIKECISKFGYDTVFSED